jgi:pterin-4a-carbinolamine dehydratase
MAELKTQKNDASVNVIVDLTTHEAQGITQKDFDLARQMEQIADKM